VADTQRKKNEDKLLIALACGATVETASKQCQISDRTIYRRLQDPEFQDRLESIRTEMVQRAAAMLTAAASEAVRTLLSLQKESVSAAVRLGAARAILEIGLKMREVVELEARIALLEEQFKETGSNKVGR
jgi:hypothetical protein